MPAFLIPVLTWIFREVLVKFLLMAFIYLVVTIMLPLMLQVVAPYLGVTALTSAFTALPPMLWYFLDVARLDVGLPVILSTAVTLFILRRVPFLNVK